MWTGDRSAAVDTQKSVIESVRPRSHAQPRRLMREMRYGIDPTTVARRTDDD
jgi:hypothetical protein